MKNKHIHLTILTLIYFAIGGCSCQRQANLATDTGNEFYSGRFELESDGTPSFTDCATFITMNIDANDAYERLRRKYIDVDISKIDKIIMEFTGTVKKQAHDTDGISERSRPIISIDSVINIYKDRDCLSDFIVPGIYQSEELDGNVVTHRRILRLKPDYTYTYSSFSNNGQETSSQGKWYRNSLMTLVLTEGSENSRIETFQIIPARESITRNNDNKPMSFKKVYL